MPASLAQTVADAKAELFAEKPKMATRASSGKALDVLTSVMPELLGGSADLTGSNKTKTKAMEIVAPGA